MSDNNHMKEQDLQIRSILEFGREDVPSRIWDCISDRLDGIPDTNQTASDPRPTQNL